MFSTCSRDDLRWAKKTQRENVFQEKNKDKYNDNLENIVKRWLQSNCRGVNHKFHHDIILILKAGFYFHVATRQSSRTLLQIFVSSASGLMHAVPRLLSKYFWAPEKWKYSAYKVPSGTAIDCDLSTHVFKSFLLLRFRETLFSCRRTAKTEQRFCIFPQNIIV